jgi:hypothetical protein
MQAIPITRTGGYFAASLPDIGPPSAAPMDGPRNARPAINGESPRTCCRFTVEINRHGVGDVGDGASDHEDGEPGIAEQ